MKILFITLLFISYALGQTGTITGKVNVRATFNTPATGVITIKIFEQETTSKGTPIQQSVGTLYQRTAIATQIFNVNAEKGKNNFNVEYKISSLPLSKSYFIMADLHTSGKTLERNIMGWYTDEKCSWLSYIKLTAGKPTVIANIEARGTIPITESKVCKFGQVKLVHNITVAQLRGDSSERGYAHGFLLAQQIIDFFRFYILESDIGSCSLYTSTYAPMVEKSLSGSGPFYFSKEMLDEVDGIIVGMKESAIDMYMPELSRNFSRVDILTINAYIEFSYLSSQSSNNRLSDSRIACSQFALWGDHTLINEELRGGIIGGRNMDGEIDVRHVTVSHFIIFAIEPSIGKRYVSFMWPGFVGTLSGINENGIYNMMNFGISSSTHVQYQNATPVSWIVRNILTEPKNASEATPAKIQSIIESFNADSGGPCVAGCVLFTIKPYHVGSSDKTASFVYEGDWKKGFMRLPAMADPYIENAILATNHFNVYGVDSDTGPQFNFGRQMSFDSLWRYMAGSSKIQGYTRSPLYQGKFDIDSMAELLRTVQHGSTEHTIIYNPIVDQKSGMILAIKFHVALASVNSKTAWDAPYLGFTTFNFNELF